MAGYANVGDLLMTQPAEGLAAILKGGAGFSRIVARLRAKIQWRPLPQDLVLEVDAIGEVIRKQYDLTAFVSIAPVDRFGVVRAVRTLESAFDLDSAFNSEGGNRQGVLHHTALKTA